jgi:acetoin utilization deacetylase AcuC-like enzyme
VPRLLQVLRRFTGPPGLSVVFDERYGRAIPGVPIDPARGAQILAFLLDRGFVRRRDVHHPVVTSLRNVLRAHTPEYVESLQDAANLEAIFGMPLTEEQAQAAVELQRLAAGGTIHATRMAIARRCTAVHLGGGFHHAGPDRGAGFCVFNDVAIAIRRLQAKGFTRKVLVLDLDLHHGNGTRAVFADDPTVHTFSVHNRSWDDRPAVESTDLALGTSVTDRALLAALREALPPLMAALRPRLVIYVAGADMAADDALGDWKISAEGMLARDRFVTEQVRALPGPVPFVIVLGGGYGYGAWRYSARYLAWLQSGQVPRLPDDMEIVLHRFRPVARELSEQALRAAAGGAPTPAPGGEWSLTEEDVLGTAPGLQREGRVLGHYSRQGLELLFERLGVFERLRSLGFTSPVVDVAVSAPAGHTVRVFGERARRHLLIELRLGRSRSAVPGCEVAFVEWLLLQNPRARFQPDRPPLPGQQYPGLGMLGLMAGALVLACEQAGLDGVAHVLSHFHLAVVGRWHMHFLDPAVQGRFDALREALDGLSLAGAERALADGRVRDAGTGAVVRWEPALAVVPVSERLRAKVTGADYDAAVAAARGPLAYVLRKE